MFHEIISLVYQLLLCLGRIVCVVVMTASCLNAHMNGRLIDWLRLLVTLSQWFVGYNIHLYCWHCVCFMDSRSVMMCLLIASDDSNDILSFFLSVVDTSRSHPNRSSSMYVPWQRCRSLCSMRSSMVSICIVGKSDLYLMYASVGLVWCQCACKRIY